MKISLVATIGSYENMDEGLAAQLKEIPNDAPFSKVINTITEWAINDIEGYEKRVLMARSPKLDF